MLVASPHSGASNLHRGAELIPRRHVISGPTAGRCHGCLSVVTGQAHCSLAGDWDGAAEDARWALEQGPGEAASPIGRYGAALAALVLGEDERAGALAGGLQGEPEEAFPGAVADAVVALAAGEAQAYAAAVARVLESFESRDAYLEDIPVADTVLVLEALAERRGLAARPVSPLLP